MRRHVALCESCRQVVEGQQSLWSALDAWEAPEVSAGFDQALARRIETAPFYQRWLEYFSWKPALSAVAVAAALLAVVTLREPAAAPVPAEADVADVEKLEQALEDIEILTVLNTAGQPAQM